MKLSRYFFKKWQWIFVITAVNLLLLILNFVEPQITSKALTNLQGIRSGEISTFITALKTTGYFFAIEVLLVAFDAFSGSRLRLLGIEISRQIQQDLATALSKASSKSIALHNPDKLIERIADAEKFTLNVLQIYSQSFTVLISLAVMVYTFFVNKVIFLLFLITFVLILVLSVASIPKRSGTAKEISASVDSIRHLIKEALESFLEYKVQSFALGKYFISALDEKNSLASKEVRIETRNNVLIRIVNVCYIVVFLTMSVFLLYNDYINIETVITLFLYKNYITRLVKSTTEITKCISKIRAYYTRMSEIFDYTSVKEDSYGSIKLHSKDILGELSIKNVTVSLDGHKVLDDISLTLPSNSFIGIVGSSGCGKSTLLKVLAHELIPDKGSVCIDGIDINSLTCSSLRSAIRLAPQESHIFSSLTFRQNLMLVNSKVSDDRIWQALDYVSARDFVRELGGLDAFPHGLSGGQKQKLALARLILKKSRIFLLDEATSAMDNISQAEIIKLLTLAKQDHSFVMVAHRLSTLKNADMIVHMENGSIVDTGTFDELLKRDALFKKMVLNEPL